MIKDAVDRGRLDLGICTQISEGGQIIAHDPVAWPQPPEFVFQKHKPLSLATFEEDCIFRTWAVEALKKAEIEDGLPVLPVSNIALHKTRKVSSKIIDCFSEYVIKSFREKTEG